MNQYLKRKSMKLGLIYGLKYKERESALLYENTPRLYSSFCVSLMESLIISWIWEKSVSPISRTHSGNKIWDLNKVDSIIIYIYILQKWY